jgi:lipoyl(octanoyl) transferase
LHGISINVAPNLKHFEGIVPCGLTGDGVTSIKEMGYTSGFKEIDAALMHTFEEIFNGNSTY